MMDDEKRYYVHSSSIIDDGVEIGDGTKIWHFCHVLSGSKIGNKCMLGQNVLVGPNVIIGDGCKIQNNVSVYIGVRLEDDVFCGPSMVFTNVLNPRAFVERKDEFTDTLVRKGATIGANATIVGNVTIGRYAMVGAGSVITKNIPDYALVVGAPGRQVGWMCKCGEVLTKKVHAQEKETLGCDRCNSKYEHEGNIFKPAFEGM